MKNLLILPCLLLTLLMGTPASSADYQKGVTAYERGDYATALREWTPLAKQGHADAQNKLGWMYVKGQGVPEDASTAVKWYRLAVEQGNAAAQSNLGWMYAEGLGVSQDYKTAVKWYRLAAKQGYASAQVHLGVMYANGRGVPQDCKTAVKWYRLALGGQEKLVERLINSCKIKEREGSSFAGKFDKYEKVLKRITMTCLGSSQSGYGRTVTKIVYSTDGKDLYYSRENIPDRVVRSGVNGINSVVKKKGKNIWIFFVRQVEVYVNFEKKTLIEKGHKKSCF
jgi:hypothetical protein